MEIRRPTWHIKQICPHCGQGKPTFCYCTKCGFVTLSCEETGDTFKNPMDFKEGFTDRCPKCSEEDVTDFDIADPDRIINAGFGKEDYE